MNTILLTVAAFGIAMFIMALGVIIKGRCIQGTCGGEEIIGPNGELLNCDHCPTRKEKEAKLRAEELSTP